MGTRGLDSDTTPYGRQGLRKLRSDVAETGSAALAHIHTLGASARAEIRTRTAPGVQASSVWAAPLGAMAGIWPGAGASASRCGLEPSTRQPRLRGEHEWLRHHGLRASDTMGGGDPVKFGGGPNRDGEAAGSCARDPMCGALAIWSMATHHGLRRCMGGRQEAEVFDVQQYFGKSWGQSAQAPAATPWAGWRDSGGDSGATPGAIWGAGLVYRRP